MRKSVALVLMFVLMFSLVVGAGYKITTPSTTTTTTTGGGGGGGSETVATNVTNDTIEGTPIDVDGDGIVDGYDTDGDGVIDRGLDGGAISYGSKFWWWFGGIVLLLVVVGIVIYIKKR